MKRMLFFILVYAMFFPVSGSHYTDPGKLITVGLDEYEKKGITPAITLWEIDTSDAVVTAMLQAEKTLGKVTSNEIICQVDISNKFTVVYAVIFYEYGPLFMEFTLFNSVNNWIVRKIREVDCKLCSEMKSSVETMENLDEMVHLQKKIITQLEEGFAQVATPIEALNKAVEQLSDKVKVQPVQNAK